MQRIYLDHAATTPLDPLAERAMEPYLGEAFGNPNSLHFYGQEAQAALDRSRELVGKTIGAGFREVLFTGSATEANNLALRGVVRRFRERYPEVVPKLVVSAIEHESVLETAKSLAQEGVGLVILPVDRDGCVDPESLERSLDQDTALVSIMYVNNEVGAVMPVADIARRIAAFRAKENAKRPRGIDCVYPVFHTDAVQGFPYVPCTAEELGADLITLSAHKAGGPKGVGVLYRKDLGADHEYLAPILTGGGQEFGLRSGTQNVAGIAGMAIALREAAARREKERARLESLSTLFMALLTEAAPGVERNGAGARGCNTPHILSVSFPDRCGDDLLVRFDSVGVAASSGSACAARSPEPSHVLLAMGRTKEGARGAVRFSFGRTTEEGDIRKAVERIKSVL